MPTLGKLRSSALALLITLATAPSHAADDGADARKLAGEAMDLFAAGDYQASLDKFNQADAIADAPTLKLRIARCLDKLDRLQEAVEKYREVIAYELTPSSKAVYRQARQEAVPELSALLEQIPSVIVTVEGPGASEARVTMGGTAVDATAMGQKQAIDPGFVTFEATVADRKASEQLEVARGQSVHVKLVLPAEAVDVAPPVIDGDDGSAMWIGGWVAIGVGGAGLVLGTVAGALVLSQEGDLEARCLERRCPPEAHDDARSFDTMRTLTTVGFIVGGVGVAVGTTLLILASGSDEQARVQPLIGPAYAGVRLRF